ncbi:MAG: EAL domain-containing protein [Thiobacillus sp.]|nr:EAL domain-containing protein [Gammaproteobacteria bacterium]MDO9007163.1 EAL domain-containing protein [Thiobacillus sp.]MDP1924444.1 EAL domain-containing protein [Thiobacillus sp.]MDP3125146.1 EAL domain-containing protein [Thiobacillus sp.]
MFMPDFISLKWKLLLPLTLAMAAGTITLTWVNDTNLRHTVEQTRRDDALRNEALLRFLVQQNERQLLDAGSALADFLVIGSSSDALGLESAAFLQPYWDQLSLNQGFQSLRLYDADQQLIIGFGNAATSDEQIRSKLGKVLAEERPVSVLHCVQTCQFIGMVPVLHRGITIGAVVVSMDLSGLLSAFKQSSGRDLAIAIDEAATILLLTTTEPALISQFDSLDFTPYPQLERIESALSHSDKKTYEWQKLRPLAAAPNTPLFIARKDVTADEQAIERIFLSNLITGLGVFVLAELMLLLALIWFMRRMNRVSSCLPLLGQGNWQQVRQYLRIPDKSPRDEISVLKDAALALAGQLETLDTETRNQQNDLGKLVDTLSHERDFISGLLDTAQALILTQDQRGVIRMANHYSESLTGLTENQLVGQDYFEMMIAQQERQEWRARLLTHFSRDPAPLRFEAPLVTASGLRNITWVHSLIGQTSGSDPLILSVGLDLTELKSAQARASYLSDYDTLTGLYNRQGFQRRLTQILLAAQGGSLLLIDLDDFKAINDLAGHSAGDSVIQHMAERLRELKPEPRLAARLGGDEFALFFDLMPDASLLQTARLLCKGEQKQHIATACIGITTLQANGTGADTETLMGQADLALSQARSKGRSNWHLYNPKDGIRENLLDRTEQLALMTDALHNNRLELYLQPIIDVKSGQPAHYEALLRVHTADGRTLPPAPLIAAAEASGLIREIDLWVLQHVIELIALWPGLHLAANLSARSLDNPELPALLRKLLKEHRVDPQQLTLEITETAALNQLAHAEALLSGIKALGCKLALDDFGVGFSTFQYLKHLPVDFVKIDGSFIRTLDQSEDDQLFVKALVEAIHGYGKQAVAEYVENEAILKRVTALGIDFAQGYHFGRPQPVQAILGASPNQP